MTPPEPDRLRSLLNRLGEQAEDRVDAATLDAMCVAAFHQELVSSGVDSEEATHLTHVWMAENTAPMPEEPEEQHG